MAAVTEPSELPALFSRKVPEISLTSSSPDSPIIKAPISLVVPNLFLKDLSILSS